MYVVRASFLQMSILRGEGWQYICFSMLFAGWWQLLSNNFQFCVHMRFGESKPFKALPLTDINWHNISWFMVLYWYKRKQFNSQVKTSLKMKKLFLKCRNVFEKVCFFSCQNWLIEASQQNQVFLLAINQAFGIIDNVLLKGANAQCLQAINCKDVSQRPFLNLAKKKHIYYNSFHLHIHKDSAFFPKCTLIFISVCCKDLQYTVIIQSISCHYDAIQTVQSFLHLHTAICAIIVFSTNNFVWMCQETQPNKQSRDLLCVVSVCGMLISIMAYHRHTLFE